MADGSRIEWTEATWNPLRGCSRVSAGCQRCYAERVAARFAGAGQPYRGLIHPTTGGWNGTVRLVPEVLDQPIRWQRERMIFVNSMSDLFHESVPDDWIDTIYGIMWACLYTRRVLPGHVFQVLTKRPERMRDYLLQDRRRQWADAAVRHGGGLDPDGIFDQTIAVASQGAHPRIWLGVSVEDQRTADERVPLLLETPAACRWISAEPLLGLPDLTRICDRRRRRALWINAIEAREANQGHAELVASFGPDYPYNRIDWVVAGGESGPGSRPMHPAWARSLRDQCAAAGVPFFFKQFGDYVEWTGAESPSPSCRMPDMTPMVRVGKKEAGRLLDGALHDAFPEVSCV